VSAVDGEPPQGDTRPRPSLAVGLTDFANPPSELLISSRSGILTSMNRQPSYGQDPDSSHPPGTRESASTRSRVELESLPGGSLVAQGLSDLARGRQSVPALLVLIGAPRLRRLGLAVPEFAGCPEHSLYALLSRSDPNSAHSRYNALIRKLVSFERAAECVFR
jgi:hypothetical protein